MNVKNRKCIRKLSLKSLYANRRRNLIAIFAIALTTLLFTSMFTIVLSLNASYETYQFRQVGGYAHGTFKDVSPEQAERIAAHPKVKATGARKVIGITAEGVFAKIPAEISYMDANCTKWSYATPTTGRMPESGKEVAMDTAALQLLGVTPELGTEVTVSYSITDKDQTAFTVTDTFTLVGYWDYDELMPVHYINISRDYADDIEAQAVKTGLQPFRTDLNVMLASGTNIQGQMEQVDTDLGYTWDSYTDPNSVRIGVNWGYTSSQLESQFDPELMVAIAAFLLRVNPKFCVNAKLWCKIEQKYFKAGAAQAAAAFSTKITALRGDVKGRGVSLRSSRLLTFRLQPVSPACGRQRTPLTVRELRSSPAAFRSTSS